MAWHCCRALGCFRNPQPLTTPRIITVNGYIWNYDTQQWDVDLNYDHSQGQAQAQNEEAPTTLEAPQAAPEAIPGEYDYDYTEYGGYHAYMAAHGYVYDDVTGSYSYPNYEDPYHAGYDQGQYTTEAVGAAEASPADYSQYYQDPQSSQYYPDQYYQDPQAVPDTAGQYYQDPNGAVDYYQASQAVPDASGQYYQDQQYYPDPNGTSDAAQQYYQDPQAVPDASGQYYEDPQASHQYYQDPQAVPDASTQYYQNPDVAQQYYQDPQAVPDPSSQYYPDPNGTAQQYYQDPAYHAGYDQPEEHHPPPRPAVPVFTEPLFKQQQNVQDPYAWDSSAVAQAPAQAPVRPAAPSRPEPPKPHETTYDAPAPPRPPPAARPPPPRPAPAAAPKPKEPEPAPEEDAWTQFKKMTEKVSDVVKNTESTLKNLSETSATKDIKDESYLAEIGGSQGFVNESTQREIQRLTEEKKNEKLLKKKLKQQGKKVQSPTYDPDEEDAMDRAAQELAMKMANNRTDIGDWKPPPGVAEEIKKAPEKPAREEDSISAIPPRKKSSIKDVHQDSGGSLELPMHLSAQKQDSISPKGDFAPDDPILSAPAWADFESTDPVLPPSESGFFSNKDNANDTSNDIADPFQTATSTVTTNGSSDPFAPVAPSLIDDSYDPFAVRPVEDVVAMAKAKAEEAAAAAADDDDFFVGDRHSPALSTPTPEGGSPLSQRPNRFEDDFKCEGMGLDTPTPLYDEDDTEPLTEYLPRFSGDGWDLMIRHPIKKKSFMAERYWKPCFVRLHGTTLLVYNDRKDSSPIQELLLQATYSLSDTTLQAYDVYGKIHTVKLQFVVYKEKVGIRPGQISRLVEGHVTKYGLPLEHSAQCTVLLKFGSLNAPELQSFVTTVEDILFKCHISRTTKPVYKQDEVQIHCYDEYSAFVDKDGVLSDQKARVRMFCLAFLTGTPFLEIGLNDRRRQGKEIVRRKDILPMHTERWIRFEALEFHSIVDRNEFDKEQVIRFSPPDGCFFEIMRFRIRPPRNREKAMTVKSIMKIAGSKVEIRIEAMAAAQIQRTRGAEERRNIPCEDIAIRFPIPEAWIYIFREERHWGVGSVHSKKLRPGKVKNLKDRLLGAVQTHEANLIECAIGEAKYEHVYRSLVWRIPRLPEKHHAAYKSHLLRCRFELSSFDLMPEEFLPRCEVDFTMPLATVSNTVVRSVSVEQHEDSDRVEKFVRYVAKYQYKVEIDYIQCANLDIDTADPSVNPEAAAAPVPDLHAPQIHPDGVSKMHEGYRIDFDESEMGRHGRKDDDSSSDDEVDSHKMPVIQIDMKNYGY
ncbi:unnamed protein product [Caenorhabditis auriculariae]|uniref:Uncharacterized protein n=1 Tax=Caenorhabditis auriculariae TaxID=2777116 RepID=A0A8S1H2D2_9PELO|nr:unnamed protein product [Caenorhabditis auriculariae]